MLGWDCIYSTGPIIAEGNQKGRADRANASYMAEIKAQANIPSAQTHKYKDKRSAVLFFFIIFLASQESLEDAASPRVSSQNQVH